MSVFSQWCHSAHRLFSASHPRLRLGQVQEVMAAALGHKTYASFKALDLPSLDQAAYALVSVEAMARRAADLSRPIEEKLCREAVRQLRLGRAGDGRYVLTDGRLAIVTSTLLQDADHPAQREFARELNGELDGTTASFGEPSSPLTDNCVAWYWTVRGSVNVLGAEEGWSIPVVAKVVIPRLGRSLFAKGEITSLQRDGEITDYEPQHTTEYSYISGLDD